MAEGGITVKAENGQEKKLQPNKQPLQEQVKALCDECDLHFDTEDNYYVLVQSSSSSSGAPIVRNEVQLMSLSSSSKLSLMKGANLVTERLKALEAADNIRAVPAALKGLLAAIYGDSWLADEVIERDGIRKVFKLVLPLRPGMDTVVEIAMACLCELFQYGAALTWLEGHLDDVSPQLFKQFFDVLFPAQKPKSESKLRTTQPRATLSVFQFFLQMLPACANAAHSAAVGVSFSPKADASDCSISEPIYPRIVQAYEGSDEFEQTLATAVLAAMVTSADNQVGARIKTEIGNLAADSELEDMLSKDTKTELVDKLITVSMGGCAEMAVAAMEASSGGGGGGDSEATRKLEKRSERLEEERENLKGQLRLAHERMKAMVKFVKVEAAQLVEQSLDSIVKSGWDSIHWKRNYNLLHYCAECVEDPTVVELVGLFATNIDQKEDGGKRAIDFARATGRQGVIKVLERLRKTVSKGRMKKHGNRGMGKSMGGENEGNDGMTYGLGGSGGGGLSKQELMTRFNKLKEKGGLTKPLQKAIETVLDVGWGNVEWPSNFTAMHLAAKVGTVESIELLVAAGAEIAIADDWRLTPLDYAAQANRTEIIMCLQSHVGQKGGGGQGGGGGGQGGGGRKPPREPDAEERKKLKVPDGLRPELQRACEAVIKKGWSKIKWPHDFTALHLAGRLGSTEAATLLIKASAWPGLELKDDKGLTPLDYAKDKNHENLVTWFRQFQAEHGLIPGVGGTGGNGTGGPGDGTGGNGTGGTGTGGTGNGTGNGSLNAGPPGRAGRSAIPGGVDVSGLDLAQERIKAMERDPEELGLNELRSELEKLRKEKNAWQQEKNNMITSGMKAGATPTEIPATGGPLDEEAMIRYLKELQAFGREAVAMKLMDSESGGGLNLDQQDAIRALAQLDFVCKIAANASLVHAAGGTGGGGPGGGKGGGGGGDGDGSGGDGKGGKKGKKGKAEPKAEEAKAEEGKGGKKGKKGGAPDAKDGKGGKKGGPPGKGPGKGPPPPGAKKGAPGAKDGGKGGGGKGVDNTLSKPKLSPKQPMKPIWWTRLILGQQIKEGETVWDEVEDNHDVLDIPQLEARFSKNATAPKEKPKKDGESAEKKEEVKLLRIITDPNVVVGKEASLKQLPPAQEMAKALEELDETSMSLDELRIVRDNACPNPAQMKELVEARKAQPNVPLALPEQYMWVIGNMPAYQQRLDCWQFTRTYGEKQETYKTNLAKFEAIVDCFTQSDMLPSLLGLVLATGNYLNGGTNRGQADGFDVETLNKLEAVKDATGKDIRHYMFDIYFNALIDKAAILIEELAPCFGNVSRRLSKDSDGTEKLSKSARIVMEDFDGCVQELQKEFTERHETMQMILQYFEDPADPFKMRMPTEFATAKDAIDDLVQVKDSAKDKYSKLLNWFKIAGMKSSEFCMLWDNFFIPPDMIVNKSEKMKKEILVPTFCQPKTLAVDDLMVLWEFKDPSERRTAPRAAKQPRGKKADRRKTVARDRNKGENAEEGEAKAGSTAAPETAPKGKGGAPPGGKGKAPAPGKGKGKAAPTASEEPAPTPSEAPAPSAKGKSAPPGKGKGKSAPAPATEETPAFVESSPPAPGGKGPPPAGKGKKGGAPSKGGPPPATETAAPEVAEAPAPAPKGKGKGKKK